MIPEFLRDQPSLFRLSRLALGTAQLAGAYGIVGSAVNESSGIDANANALLHVAQELRLASVDTAPAYGRAEKLIGSSNWQGPIWTKLDSTIAVVDSIERSLRALRRTWIDVLFIHDMAHLRGLSRHERAQLRDLVGATVGALGISAYETEDVLEAHESLGISVVQAPLNVFDTRFEQAVVEGRLPEGLTYLARSALLQGALAEPTTAAERLAGPLADHLVQWSRLCQSLSLKPGEAALGWALSREFVDAVIVGAEDAGQLRQIASWSEGQRASEILNSIRASDLWPLSDPRRW